jgi:aminoglycoside phosphotransferase (APT) family kinase protein
MKLHHGELDLDAGLVARLLDEQLPHLAGRPVTAFSSTGTENAIFRIGDDLYARLPRLEAWAAALAREARWLPQLAPRLSLQVPEIVAFGRPGCAYPLPWAVYRWIEGRPYADDTVGDEVQAARALARFVHQLRDGDVDDEVPAAGRRPLSEVDGMTRESIAAAGDLLDRPAVTAAWERALEAPLWDGRRTWIHGDLLRPNLLVREGRLAGVLDFGSTGAGDPAMDVIPAWAVFGPEGRGAYREALAVDDADWERARGVALTQAIMIVPYYVETNPAFVTLAQRTIEQILLDLAEGG